MARHCSLRERWETSEFNSLPNIHNDQIMEKNKSANDTTNCSILKLSRKETHFASGDHNMDLKELPPKNTSFEPQVPQLFSLASFLNDEKHEDSPNESVISAGDTTPSRNVLNGRYKSELNYLRSLFCLFLVLLGLMMVNNLSYQSLFNLYKNPISRNLIRLWHHKNI